MSMVDTYQSNLERRNRIINIVCTRGGSRPKSEGGQKGGQRFIRGGRDYIRGRGRGGIYYIRGGRRGHILYQGGQEGGQVIFEGGLVPPLAPPWIRHWSVQGFLYCTGKSLYALIRTVNLHNKIYMF